MNTYFKMSIMALIPIVASILFYLLDTKTSFNKIKYRYKQLILGVAFGIIAICNTEFGVNIDGATMNVRDAAPICAGLLFGAPAGIISGIVGGVERFFAVYWGAGEVTQIACCISTIIAGFVSAILRKYLFENKRPGHISGLMIAIIIEVSHMMILFFINTENINVAYSIVAQCSIPMITLNGLSVLGANFSITLFENKFKKKNKEPKFLSQIFQNHLFVCFALAFLATFSFSYIMQTQLALKETENILHLNIEDIKNSINDEANNNLLKVTKIIVKDIEEADDIDITQLLKMADKYEASEINIINEDGIIETSSIPAYINYNMNYDKQSAEFLVLLDGKTTTYIQKYQQTAIDSDIYRKYVGVALQQGGFVQVGYNYEQFQNCVRNNVIGATKNRHIGENGSIIITNNNYEIISDQNDNYEVPLSSTGINIENKEIKQSQIFTDTVNGVPSYCVYLSTDGYYAIATMPVSEALFSRNIYIYLTIFMELLIFGILFILVYFLIKKHIVNNIQNVNTSLGEITNGNMDVVVNVRKNKEFDSLSNDINTMVDTMKKYIAEEAARINRELEFAHKIQYAALPRELPTNSNEYNFEIFATMDAAKEVGGDFYDYYLLPNNKLAFLIADVSGKGIPAAMFMMTAKTMIKNLAEAGFESADILTIANKKLCENNDADMFVTVWIGILDLNSGLLEYSNAGHNPPLICYKNNNFEFLKGKSGLVLAGMEGIKYKKNELQLSAGDEIFLYTDGVTEAVNKDNQLYGDNRLLNILNQNKNTNSKTLCKKIKNDVDLFAGKTPQFDDITMLFLRYKGGEQ